MIDRFRLEAELSALLLDLPLDAAWLDGIAGSLELLASHAALVLATTLPPGMEPAPVFVP